MRPIKENMNISCQDLQKVICRDRRSGKERRLTYDSIYIGPDKRSYEDRRSGIERRRQNRLRVKDGSFAAIISDNYIIGPIQNISSDGFAFRYIGKGGQIQGSLEVDIFYCGMGFYLVKLPSKAIFDFTIDKKASDISVTIRHCGVQFGELTNDHIFHLEKFIQKYEDRRYDKDRRILNVPLYTGPERRKGLEGRKTKLEKSK